MTENENTVTPDTVISAPSPADIVRRVALDLRATELYRRRAAAVLPALQSYADALKQAEPTWLTSRSDEAQLVREIEALTTGHSANADAGRALLTTHEAAARFDGLKPDGRVKDSFYRHVAKQIGGYRVGTRWQFPLDRIEAFEKGSTE